MTDWWTSKNQKYLDKGVRGTVMESGIWKAMSGKTTFPGEEVEAYCKSCRKWVKASLRLNKVTIDAHGNCETTEDVQVYKQCKNI